MKTRLDFGILVDKEGEACPAGAALETLVPGNHQYLFDFMQADLGHIMDLVKEGVKNHDHEKIVTARDILRDAHPYMRLDDSIANAYINRELARASWVDNNKDLMTEEDFVQLGVFTPYQSTDMHDYLTTSDADGYGSMYSLLCYQTDLRYKVFLLLDKSNPNYSDIPFETRCGIYGIFSINGYPYGYDYEPEIRIPSSKVILPYPKAFGGIRAAVDFDEDLHIKLYKEINGLIYNQGAEIPDIRKMIDSIRNDGNTEAYEEYRIESLENLLDLETFLMIRDHVSVGKCESCGKYFAYPSGTDELTSVYCDYQDKDGNSCLSAAREKAYADRLRYIYTRAYKTRFDRMKAGKITKAELDQWREMAQEEKKKVVSGKITLEQYKVNISAFSIRVRPMEAPSS